MSILINGMEMPIDHPLWIVVHSDGTVEANEVSQSRPVGWQTLRNAAVPVPPHGRLIDADALRTLYEKWHSEEQLGVDIDACHVPIPVIRQNIDDAPTIIPASEEVYDKYTDTAGNLHWTGTHSGKHIVKAEEV